MHRARVVRQQQPALLQLINQLLQRGLPDSIHAAIAKPAGDLVSKIDISRGSKKNPFHLVTRRDRLSDFQESFGQPALSRAEFSAWTKAK